MPVMEIAQSHCVFMCCSESKTKVDLSKVDKREEAKVICHTVFCVRSLLLINCEVFS